MSTPVHKSVQNGKKRQVFGGPPHLCICAFCDLRFYVKFFVLFLASTATAGNVTWCLGFCEVSVENSVY